MRGIDEDGSGFRAAVVNRRAGSREEVDAPSGDSGLRRWQNCRRSRGDGVGRYSGHFTDPDGFLWKVASA